METNDNQIKLLHLEDEVMDVYLVKKVLERSRLSCDITVASDRQTFLDALDNHSFDLVLADHSLPQFTAMDALRIMKERDIVIPFILVTGTVSEEYSVNAMKEGAWDYILKDRLQRLPVAARSAVDRHIAETERKKYLNEVIAKEALMKEAERLARFGSWQYDVENEKCVWSDEMYRILGYNQTEVEMSFDDVLAKVHQDEREQIAAAYGSACKSMNELKFECRLVTGENELKHIVSEIEIKRNSKGEMVFQNGFVRDVSESRSALLKTAESEKKYRKLFENSPVPTWLVDMNSRKLIDVNLATVHRYEYDYDELVGLTLDEVWVDYAEGNSATSGSEQFTTLISGIHRTKHGKLLSVKVSVGDVTYDGKNTCMMLVTESAEANNE